MLTVGLVVFGLFSYPKIGVDLFPNVEFPFVTVTVIYPGADPQSMETKVAKPIEDALSSMSGIKVLQSINLESATQVLIQFDLDVDRDQATQDVRDRISAIENQLPDAIEAPKIQKFDVGAVPIMSVALSGDLPPRELTRLADDVVKERIQRIKGVGNVDLVGGRDREIHVEIDPAKLAARGLTAGDVAMALRGGNLELPAGLITEGTRELVVTTKGAFDDLQELANTPIMSGPGFAVRVGDVARIVDDMAEKRSHASVDGKPAVALVVQKESGANTVEVAKQIQAELAALEPQLAEQGATLTVVSNSAPFIERSFHEVQFDLLLGGILAVVIVLGFLRDWRATFIAALALPTSVIATFWFLNLMDFTFNQMTMLALSLSIGLLIDDAIVVIENIHRHLEMGKTPLRAAAEATSEIGLAVLATTLSIVAVFAPVATMQGIVGRFFFQFGLTVSIAVLVSLFVSFTLTPMMSSKFLRATHGGPKNVLSRGIEWVLTTIERAYKATLRLALRQRALTLVVAALTLVGSCVLAGKVKTEFLPAEDRSQFSIDVELPTGTSLETTTAVLETIATDVRATAPKVVDTFVTIGGGAQGQVNIGKVQVDLVGPKQRGFTQQDAMAWARERYSPLNGNGLKIKVNQIDPMGGDSGFRSAPVQFNLRGKDMDELIAAADALKAELATIPGFVDIDSTYRAGKPQLEIEPDRLAASSANVPVANIATTLRALVARDKVTEYKEGVDIYEVKLTLPERVESGFATLSNMQVRAGDQSLVPLDSVVKVEPGLGPSEIDRQARMRQITILASLDGIALGEASTKLEAAAKKVVPSNITTETSGMGQIMAESFGYMFVALILAIILVYMILAAQFESLLHPFTIMLSLPFAVVGAFGGLYLAGQTLSIFSMIGLIMLMGLVTKNAILLVDFTNHKKAEGLSTRDALLVAGPIRLRPILMTTMAMILGMLPVALALGEGGETRAPMAVVVIGGLITSTVLTLVVVPVVYSLIEGLRERIGGRKPPKATLVEG
ncbi:MAG: efflux RND transporter permease subunit [Kofleriaceae bacterium]|nr:efflux RND transporter permease subunit [Myxococcales bacterium]MCB9562783.1 efflux RND transporter permease subunit [Kofleriaceae bacterium]MCB9571102.1 efflux RND transporter permease subunit [Kofleriaceae bacterium]